MEKQIYKIPCTWEMWGILEVEAESLEEATQLAIEECPLPADGHYMEDSFQVDIDSELYGELA